MFARTNHRRVSLRGRSRQLIWYTVLLALFGAPIVFKLDQDGNAPMLFVGAIVFAIVASFLISADADDEAQDSD